MKKYLKVLFCITISTIMIFTLCSCTDPIEEAETNVTAALTALQEGDMKKAESILGSNNDISSTLIETDNSLTEKQTVEMSKAIFKNLNFKILSSKEKDDGSVDVKLKVSNVDMSAVMDDWFDDIVEISFKAAYSGDKLTKKETNNELIKAFKKNVDNEKKNKKIYTKKIKINVVEKDGKWIPQPSDKATNALTGGLVQAAKDLQNKLK